MRRHFSLEQRTHSSIFLYFYLSIFPSFYRHLTQCSAYIFWATCPLVDNQWSCSTIDSHGPEAKDKAKAAVQSRTKRCRIWRRCRVCARILRVCINHGNNSNITAFRGMEHNRDIHFLCPPVLAGLYMPIYAKRQVFALDVVLSIMDVHVAGHIAIEHHD